MFKNLNNSFVTCISFVRRNIFVSVFVLGQVIPIVEDFNLKKVALFLLDVSYFFVFCFIVFFNGLFNSERCIINIS